jgi:hypothetical protein
MLRIFTTSPFMFMRLDIRSVRRDQDRHQAGPGLDPHPPVFVGRGHSVGVDTGFDVGPPVLDPPDARVDGGELQGRQQSGTQVGRMGVTAAPLATALSAIRRNPVMPTLVTLGWK